MVVSSRLDNEHKVQPEQQCEAWKQCGKPEGERCDVTGCI